MRVANISLANFLAVARLFHGTVVPLVSPLRTLDFNTTLSMITGTYAGRFHMTIAVTPGILCHDVRCFMLLSVFGRV